MTSSLSCCLCGGVYATCECDNRTHGLAGMHVLQARLVRLLLAHEKKTREVENQKQMLTDILKCCGVDATAFVEAPGRAATQLTQHVNELQLARDVLLARGSRVNLTHMLGAHQERGEALLGACKKLVSAGLGSLSRHVPGSVLLLDFAGLSPVTLTIERKNLLRDAIASLVSSDLLSSEPQRDCLPAYACLHEVILCACRHPL
jgi:hypothetical protein